MDHLQNKRFWLGGGAIAALLIVALGWFMFIGPERSSASDLRSQAAATRQQNALLQLSVTSLQKKSTQLSRYTSSLKTGLSALPFDSGLPAFTRQLSAQAKAHQVSVTSVVVGGITAIAAGGTAGAPAATSATDPTSSAPTTSTTTPTVGTNTATGGLYSVQVTVQSTGTLARQLAFINDIRTAGPRRAMVNSAQLTPGVGAKESSIDGLAAVTTQLTVFSAPQPPAKIAALNKLLRGKIGN
jgi:hypothetical protein